MLHPIETVGNYRVSAPLGSRNDTLYTSLWSLLYSYTVGFVSVSHHSVRARVSQHSIRDRAFLPILRLTRDRSRTRRAARSPGPWGPSLNRSTARRRSPSLGTLRSHPPPNARSTQPVSWLCSPMTAPPVHWTESRASGASLCLAGVPRCKLSPLPKLSVTL
jgi:hypothetical protein